MCRSNKSTKPVQLTLLPKYVEVIGDANDKVNRNTIPDAAGFIGDPRENDRGGDWRKSFDKGLSNMNQCATGDVDHKARQPIQIVGAE